MLSKKCLICSDIFFKKVFTSLYDWSTRSRYCSRECSDLARRKNISISDTKRCPICGKGFSKPAHCSIERWNNVMKFCSRRCRYVSRSGVPTWNTGLIMTPEQKKRMNLDGLSLGRGLRKGEKFPEQSGKNHPSWKPKTKKSCSQCSKIIFLPPWRLSPKRNTRRFFCNRQCWALGTRGKGSPVYLGELATQPLRHRVMEMAEYSEWHAKVLKRDKYLCIQCQSRKSLEVDHIISYRSIVKKFKVKTVLDARNCKELWDIDNGRTLCRKCHCKTDTYGYSKTFTS